MKLTLEITKEMGLQIEKMAREKGIEPSLFVIEVLKQSLDGTTQDQMTIKNKVVPQKPLSEVMRHWGDDRTRLNLPILSEEALSREVMYAETKCKSDSNSEKSIMEKLLDLSFDGGPPDLAENHDDYVLGKKP